MPTAAEVALQKKYADMRAKKQQQVRHTEHVCLFSASRSLKFEGIQMEKTKAVSSPPAKRDAGPVRGTADQSAARAGVVVKRRPAGPRQCIAAVIVKSKNLQSQQQGQQSPFAAKQAKLVVKQALPAVKQGPKVTLSVCG